MRHGALVLCCLLSVAHLVTPAKAAVAARQQHSVLADVKGLEQRVTLTEERRARLVTPQEQERSRRFSLARTLQAPILRTLAKLVGSLTPRQWELLQQAETVTFSTDPGPGELRLPAESASAFRAAQPTPRLPGSVPSDRDPEAVERSRQVEKQMQEQWAAATGYRVRIRMGVEQFRTGGVLDLEASPEPIRGGPPPGPSSFQKGPATNLLLFATPMDGQAARQLRENPAQRLAELEQEPILGARKRFQPEAKPYTVPPEMGSGTLWRLRELMPELARAYGVQFIADAYWRNPPSLSPGVFSSEPVSLAALLERATRFNHQWELRGNLVRVRSRNWYFDRPREVPLRLVRRWKEIGDQRGALPLDEYVTMATTLNDGQLETLRYLIGEAGLPPEIERVQWARHALRFYALLSPARQQALAQGGMLPVAGMTPPQRARFLATLQERNRSRQGALNLAEWTAGGFAMSNRTLRRIREQRDGAIRYRLERVPAPEAGGSPAPSRGTPPSQAGPEAPRLVREITFAFHDGAGRSDTIYLTTAAPP